MELQIEMSKYLFEAQKSQLLIRVSILHNLVNVVAGYCDFVNKVETFFRSLHPMTMILAPLLANSMAVSSPMPQFPPVTTTVFPSTRLSSQSTFAKKNSFDKTATIRIKTAMHKIVSIVLQELVVK